MVEHRHLEQTLQRLQQRHVFLHRWMIGLDVLLGAVMVSCVATLVIALGGWGIPLVAVYGGIALLAFGVFAILSWGTHVTPLTALTHADQTLQSQECLSTAYEYLHEHPENPFVTALVAEAEKVAPRVEPRLVFTAQWPRRIWGIPLLLAATVGLTQLDITPLQFDDLAENEADHDVAREGKRLEQRGRELEDLAQQQQLDRSLILARHMQDLGKRLQREGAEKTQVAKRLATLSDYLERLRRELQERALMSDVGGMAVREMLASGKSLKKELQDILQLLQNDDIPREMAAVAEQSILRLQRQVGQNTDLETLLQNLRAGDLQAARQLLQDAIQQQQAAEEMAQLDRARRALAYSERAMQQKSRGEASGDGSEGDPEAGQRGTPTEFGEDMMSEDMPGMEDFSAPGSDAGVGLSNRKQDPSASGLRESEQPVSNVEVKSSGGPMRLGYMRYLPMQNKAQMPVEEAVVHYQQAAEEVLTREQIPRNYRDQIKQYFLAIGMVK